MKTIYFAALFGSSLLLATADAQEGNSAYRDLLENKHTQEILRTLKNDPEAAARAAQANPNDLIRNATAAFADSQKKKDPNARPATRGKRSQADKALSNINNMLAQPVSANAQALPVPVGEIAKYKDSARFDKLKSVARETIPELSNIIPDDAPARPQISGVPKLPEMRAARTGSPRIDVAAIQPTPLNVSSHQAPPAPIRNMQPTVPQIPDSPELYAASVPTPKKLGPRYPKPEKFRSPLPAKDQSGEAPKPKSDTMVITSNESEMNRNTNRLTFHGDVKVDMDGLNLTCDHMVVHLNKENKMEKIVATGGTVQIMKTGENGQPQLAKARKAEYIAATKTAILSGGPPYLQNGDQYINTESEDAVIELGGDGRYKVHSKNTNTPSRNVIVIPISNGKKFGGDLGIDNKLKGLSR